MKRFLTLVFFAALWGTAAARPFTAHDLVMLDRVSSPRLSLDGTLVLYSVRRTDFAANRSRSSVWLAPTNGSRPAQPVAANLKGAGDARFSPDGKFLYLLATQSGSTQVWRPDIAGRHARRITSVPVDVQEFRVTPDGKRLVFAGAVFPDCATLACTHDRLAQRKKCKSSGVVYDRIFIRHWDTWADGTKNHLFSVRVGQNAPVSLMRSFDGDSPSKPFGGDEDYAISPDSKFRGLLGASC